MADKDWEQWTGWAEAGWEIPTIVTNYGYKEYAGGPQEFVKDWYPSSYTRCKIRNRVVCAVKTQGMGFRMVKRTE